MKIHHITLNDKGRAQIAESIKSVKGSPDWDLDCTCSAVESKMEADFDIYGKCTSVELDGTKDQRGYVIDFSVDESCYTLETEEIEQ